MHCQFGFSCFYFCVHTSAQKNICMTFFLCISAAKPQAPASETRSPSGAINKPDTGSPEKTPPRGENKPELATRLRATSSSSSPGGPVSPKPPVPQGAKPALGARPTIPQKPRTTSSSRSIGTDQSVKNAMYDKFNMAALCYCVNIV